MIDREPLPRSDNSGAQASECRCGQPRGAARAVGGLLYAANRRMIGVQEPANGESRFRHFWQQQIAYQRSALAEFAETKALASLRAEIVAVRAENASLRGNQSAHAKLLADLKMMAGTPSRPGKPGEHGAIMEALGMALGEYTKPLVKWQRETDKRLAVLEQRPKGLSWKGTWSPELAYPASSVVNHNGTCWVALEPQLADEKPGTGGQWKLMVKSDEAALRKLIRHELFKSDDALRELIRDEMYRPRAA